MLKEAVGEILTQINIKFLSATQGLKGCMLTIWKSFQVQNMNVAGTEKCGLRGFKSQQMGGKKALWSYRIRKILALNIELFERFYYDEL